MMWVDFFKHFPYGRCFCYPLKITHYCWHTHESSWRCICNFRESNKIIITICFQLLCSCVSMLWPFGLANISQTDRSFGRSSDESMSMRQSCKPCIDNSRLRHFPHNQKERFPSISLIENIYNILEFHFMPLPPLATSMPMTV